MAVMSVTIRNADPSEVADVNQLMLRSKASWGYSAEFMRAAEPFLVEDEEYIRTHWNLVMEVDGVMGGYISLKDHGDSIELDNLFLEPDLIGEGYGKYLWEHILEFSRAKGYKTLWLISDPNAAGFYVKMGAKQVGERVSNVDPERMLPKFEYDLLA